MIAARTAIHGTARSAARSAHRGAARGLVLAMVGVSLAVAGPSVAQSPDPSPGAASMAPASMDPASPAPSTSAIAVTLVDFSLSPDPITVSGLTTELVVTNDGITPHNLTIRDEAGTVLAFTSTMSQGGSSPLTVTVPAPGTYVTFCSLPGHESLGLVGELIVTGDVPASAVPSSGPSAPPSA